MKECIFDRTYCFNDGLKAEEIEHIRDQVFNKIVEVLQAHKALYLSVSALW